MNKKGIEILLTIDLQLLSTVMDGHFMFLKA